MEWVRQHTALSWPCALPPRAQERSGHPPTTCLPPWNRPSRGRKSTLLAGRPVARQPRRGAARVRVLNIVRARACTNGMAWRRPGAQRAGHHRCAAVQEDGLQRRRDHKANNRCASLHVWRAALLGALRATPATRVTRLLQETVILFWCQCQHHGPTAGTLPVHCERS